jgi:hypothetical protein
VALLVIVTAAFATTAPVLSLTVPRIVPVAPAWPKSMTFEIKTSNKISGTLRSLLHIAFLLVDEANSSGSSHECGNRGCGKSHEGFACGDAHIACRRSSTCNWQCAAVLQ